jgi:hypothetical protein
MKKLRAGFSGRLRNRRLAVAIPADIPDTVWLQFVRLSTSGVSLEAERENAISDNGRIHVARMSLSIPAARALALALLHVLETIDNPGPDDNAIVSYDMREWEADYV